MAEVPTVATDIAPVHSLVAQVMGDLGVPAMIVPPGASPHSYAMRPSEARALADADLVVWVGEGLEPWLARSIETLAERADVLELLEAQGTVTHDFREAESFAEVHAEAAGGHDHDHDEVDPHAWLDPQNGRVWLAAIAAALSAADPANADTYGRNAATGQSRLDELEAGIAADLAAVTDMRFIVLHDSFQYFEARFGLQAVGAVSLSDAIDPSAARVAALRDEVRQHGIACVVAQPQFAPSLVDAVAEGSGAATIVLDPVGVEYQPGPELYAEVLRGIADGFAGCR